MNINNYIQDMIIYLGLNLDDQIAIFLSKTNGGTLSQFYHFRDFCKDSINRYYANRVLTDRQTLKYRNYPNIIARK
jgi:hypothetical protein